MTTKHMMRFGLAAALLAMGCGGPTRATKREMSDQAAKAPPPPRVDGQAKPVERTVTKQASEDFREAVEFFNRQAEGGWTDQECVAAAQRFESVGSAHEKLVEAWYNAGVAYQKCGMTKEAEAAYQKALKINPAHAPSLVNVGEIYYRGGNEKRGQEYFEQALKADGTTVAAYNNLAWIYLQKMKAAISDAERAKWEKEAIFQIRNALAVDNDNVVAYTLLALIYMEGAERNRNQLDIANMLLDEGRKRNDSYAPLWNAWGLLQMKRANVGRALQYFRKAVELDPNFVEARMNLASTILGFRKYDEAEQHFRFVLKLQPKNYDAMLGLGVALRGQRKIDEAEGMYKQAVAIDANRPDAYYNLGVLWKDFRTNDPDMKKNKQAYQTAKDYFRQFLAKASAKDPKRQDAQDNIEDCDKAIAALDQAIRQMESAPPPDQGGGGAQPQPGTGG